MAGIVPVALDVAFRNDPLDASPFWQDVTGAYPRAALADAPAAFWRLNEAHPPTTVHDEHTTVAASAHDGTTVNGPTGQGLLGPTGDGYFGMLFESANSEYVAIADSAGLRGFSALSMELWYYTTAYAACVLLCKGNTSSANTIDYFISQQATGEIGAAFRYGVSSVHTKLFTTKVTLNAWTHLVVTYDGTDLKLYQNGALLETEAGVSLALSLTTTQALTIAASAAPTEFFNGYLANVAIYGSALSATRVAVHYRAGATHHDHWRGGGYSAGRPMALGPISPGSFNLEIDDPARWLEHGFAASPYYPNVKRGKKCRFRSTTTPLITGFAEAFRTGAYGKDGVNQVCRLQAADPFKLLGRRTTIDYSVVRDSFDRADTAGLGTADKGGAWTLGAPSTDARIAGNQGQLRFTPYLSADLHVAPVAGASPYGIGGVWEVPAGSWALDSPPGSNGSIPNSANDNIAVSNSGAYNGALVASYSADATPAESWLVFRYSNSTNFWFLRRRFSGGVYEYRLFKRVAGVDTQVGATYSANMTDVRILLNGNDIVVSETGGTARISGSDSFNNTATRHGFGGVVNATFTAKRPTAGLLFAPIAIATLDGGASYAGDGIIGVYLPTSVASSALADGTPCLIFRADSLAPEFLFLQVTGNNPFTIAVGRMENGVAVQIAAWTVDATNPASYGDSYGGNFLSVSLDGTSITPIIKYWKAVGGVPTWTTYSGTPVTSSFNSVETYHGIGCPYGRVLSGFTPPLASTAFYAFNDFAFWAGRPIELTSERISALLDLLDWPAADRVIATGRFFVAALPAPETPISADYSLLSLIQQTAASDGGLFYFNAAGHAVFESGTTRSTQTRSITSQATFGNGGGAAVPLAVWPAKSSEDTDLVNDVVLTGASGSPQRAFDQTSIDDDGSYSYAETLLTESDADVLGLARALLNRNRQDIAETRTLQCDGLDSDVQAQILARGISDYVTETWAPPLGGGAYSLALFIEGYSHAFRPGAWDVEYQTSVQSRSTYWVLEHATLGVLERTTILA